MAEDLALDTEGNVIVTGWSHIIGLGYNDLTIKYNSSGMQQWARFYQGFFISNNMSRALAVDADQNIYITGSIGAQNWSCDLATIKYDPLGNIQWQAWYDYDTTVEWGLDFALDHDNVLIAALCAYPDQADADFLTLKYSQIPGNVVVGVIPTVSPIQIPANGGRFSYHLMTINNVMDSLATDFWWQVIYPGTTQVMYLGPISEILPLDSSAWYRTQTVPGNIPAGTYKYIACLGEFPGLIRASDTLYVTKLATREGPLIADWSDPVKSCSRDEISTNKLHNSSFLIHHFSISPNPFNPMTAISFKLQAASRVSLRVYDTAGRLVTTLVDGWQEVGSHEVTFDGSGLPSGLYLYRIQAGDWTSSGKMVLLK